MYDEADSKKDVGQDLREEVLIPTKGDVIVRALQFPHEWNLRSGAHIHTFTGWMIDSSAMDQDIEPIRHTLTARLRYLKIYREDVDQLLAMFQQSCEKVTISDSKHRYKTLDAMKANVPNPLREFNIQGENPGVSFLFNQMEIVRGAGTPMPSIFNELRTDETTDAADALFYKIKNYLEGFQQPGARKEFIVLAGLAFVGLFWSLIGHSTDDGQGHITLHSGALPGLLISIPAFIIFSSMGLNIKNYFSLETKRDSASFFVKYREDFAKKAVETTISLLIGGVIGYFIGHFIK